MNKGVDLRFFDVIDECLLFFNDWAKGGNDWFLWLSIDIKVFSAVRAGWNREFCLSRQHVARGTAFRRMLKIFFLNRWQWDLILFRTVITNIR